MAGLSVLFGLPTEVFKNPQQAGHPRERMGVDFFFDNVELSLELWNVIAGIPGFDD